MEIPLNALVESSSEHNKVSEENPKELKQISQEAVDNLIIESHRKLSIEKNTAEVHKESTMANEEGTQLSSNQESVNAKISKKTKGKNKKNSKARTLALAPETKPVELINTNTEMKGNDKNTKKYHSNSVGMTNDKNVIEGNSTNVIQGKMRNDSAYKQLYEEINNEVICQRISDNILTKFNECNNVLKPRQQSTHDICNNTLDSTPNDVSDNILNDGNTVSLDKNDQIHSTVSNNRDTKMLSNQDSVNNKMSNENKDKNKKQTKETSSVSIIKEIADNNKICQNSKDMEFDKDVLNDNKQMEIVQICEKGDNQNNTAIDAIQETDETSKVNQINKTNNNTQSEKSDVYCGDSKLSSNQDLANSNSSKKTKKKRKKKKNKSNCVLISDDNVPVEKKDLNLVINQNDSNDGKLDSCDSRASELKTEVTIKDNILEDSSVKQVSDEQCENISQQLIKENIKTKKEQEASYLNADVLMENESKTSSSIVTEGEPNMSTIDVAVINRKTKRNRAKKMKKKSKKIAAALNNVDNAAEKKDSVIQDNDEDKDIKKSEILDFNKLSDLKFKIEEKIQQINNEKLIKEVNSNYRKIGHFSFEKELNNKKYSNEEIIVAKKINLEKLIKDNEICSYFSHKRMKIGHSSDDISDEDNLNNTLLGTIEYQEIGETSQVNQINKTNNDTLSVKNVAESNTESSDCKSSDLNVGNAETSSNPDVINLSTISKDTRSRTSKKKSKEKNKVKDSGDAQAMLDKQNAPVDSNVAAKEKNSSSASTVVPTGEDDKEDSADNWDDNFDSDGDELKSSSGQTTLSKEAMSELTFAVGKVSIQLATLDYQSYKPKAAILDPNAYSENSISNNTDHLLELYDFSPTFTNNEIERLLPIDRDFTIKWVDDTRAIAVFRGKEQAEHALKFSSPAMKIRRLCEATSVTKAKVRSYLSKGLLETYALRPATSSFVAHNMISGALGIRSTSKDRERMKKEKDKVDEAKERKKTIEKVNEDMWENAIYNDCNSNK